MGALHSIYHLYRLRRRLHYTENELKRLRQRKLIDLLNYCYRRIPYYMDKFREIHATPDDFQSPDDLASFPILEKETLRDRPDEFIDPDMPQACLIRYRSSGSTGIPLELLYTPQERLRMGFTATRSMLHAGLKPWYRIVNITEPRHSASRNRWYHRLGLMNEQFLSIYDRSILNITKLNEIKPQVVIGFPSVLMVIGEQLSAAHEYWRPKLLFTIAEVLCERDRQVLYEQWGTEPIDLYAANEVGHIAFQCNQRRGYHINLDSLHVEILSGNKPAELGERGEIVVTNFDLRVMPIIRYRLGDIAQRIEEECSCGCQFPLLGHIAGRSDGFILSADGKPFSALEIALLLSDIRGVKQYRLLQDKQELVRVEWVAAQKDSAPEEEIREELSERLGANTQIETEKVSEITREKSGKIRTVVSTLPNPFWRDKYK